MGDVSDIVVLVLSIGAVIALLTLAWTLGVTGVRRVARARRRVAEAAARVALLEREIRDELRGATAHLEAAGAALRRISAS